VTDLDIEDLKFSGATVVIEALIENKNIFPFGFQDICGSIYSNIILSANNF
jgi:3-hydroxyacyl-CoA dehydrogenase